MTVRIPTPEERRQLAEIRVRSIRAAQSNERDAHALYSEYTAAAMTVLPGLLRALDAAESVLAELCRYSPVSCADIASGDAEHDLCRACDALAQLRGDHE